MIENFRNLVKNRYRNAQDEKDKGRPIIGWTCNFIPEEIIHAAGGFPWRLLGGTGETPNADAYLYSSCCSFVRSNFEDAITGNLDFLDGYVTGNTCDFIRRLYDVWCAYLHDKTPFAFMLGIPFKKTKNAQDLYRSEIIRFKESLEGFIGKKIPDDSLRESIELYNETRTLLSELYELRKGSAPSISGADVMDVVLAAMVSDRKIYNEMLKKLLEEISSGDTGYTDRTRLMIMGSELGDSGYLRIIENLGGLVVTDDLCTGRRYFSRLVDNMKNPVDALAERYLLNAFCPRMSPYEDRINMLKDLVKEYSVEGVIYETIKFCETHGVRYPLYKQGFDELNIPVLKLDREHRLSGKGQMTTRIQAFFETLDVIA